MTCIGKVGRTLKKRLTGHKCDVRKGDTECCILAKLFNVGIRLTYKISTDQYTLPFRRPSRTLRITMKCK